MSLYKKVDNINEFKGTHKMGEIETTCSKIDTYIGEMHFNTDSFYPDDPTKTSCCIYFKNKDTGNKIAMWDRIYSDTWKFFYEYNIHDINALKTFSVWYESEEDFIKLKELLQ